MARQASSGILSDTAAFAWQEGFAAFTVSKSQIDGVRAYVDRQVEHHRQKSFQEEFVAFLDAHEIEYDPRYLWT